MEITVTIHAGTEPVAIMHIQGASMRQILHRLWIRLRIFIKTLPAT